jgi:hypothetical protein
MATDIRGMLRFFATQFAATNDPIGQSLALIIGAIDVLTVVPDDRSPEADTRIESGVVFLQEARRKSGSQQDAGRLNVSSSVRWSGRRATQKPSGGELAR